MNASRLLAVLLLLLPSLGAANEQLTIAVASNFQSTARQLAAEFTKQSGVPVRISAGSTGKLYGQIVNGAPFDIFLAADVERPALLEESGKTVSGSRFTYAIGTLLLWSRDHSISDCVRALHELGDSKLAIANPETAPYGRAAREFLRSEGLWDKLEPSLVIGENISQTMQFAANGGARFGLIARAQLHTPGSPLPSCSWPVPVERHAPILQQAVILRRTHNEQLAIQFLEFLQSEQARRMIAAGGYLLPENRT
jgi:molybdate transport system substrate-binding protein